VHEKHTGAQYDLGGNIVGKYKRDVARPPVSGCGTIVRLHRVAKRWLALSTFAIVVLSAGSAAAADLMETKAAPIPYSLPAISDWSGFYLGGHFGYAYGTSNFSAPPDIFGSLNLAQPIDSFDEAGSFFLGLSAGYDYMLPNHFVIGGVVDASFPSFQNLSGISIGGTSNLFSPTLGAQTYSETVLAFGTARARVGYARDNWFLYATGGFAWTNDQLTLTRLANGATDTPVLWRFGWVAGAGIEFPLLPHWTASLEYLFTDYGHSNVVFPNNGQSFNSNFSLQELRVGLNYRFGSDATPADILTQGLSAPDSDLINFHGQTTFTVQGYPAIRSPFEGANSLPGAGQVRETWDATLFAGVRLWQGAEVWVEPEIDQGFGVADTHGAAGFPSAESYKLGFADPYARIQRYFIRQTIDLGGEPLKVDADVSQFAGSTTSNRLVLTIGKFAIVDMFDTNKYANNGKSDFMNWSLVNAGTFDYAGDAWGYSYGAAAEWYQDRFTVRGGIFDLSATPAGGAANAPAYGLDPTFSQYQMVGEIEERHELWGQPGKIKVTGFLSRGRAGSFQDALDLSFATGLDASDALAAVRKFQNRPGVSVNIEQQVTDSFGVFARAGWSDGNVEPWDFTDVDRTVQAGVSIAGKSWGRPDDTVGIAGVVNGIAPIHAAYFANGGLGILIGDGQLPNPNLEQIVEAYYSYAITPTTKVSVDYQFIANPAYNTERGPVNVFTARFHWQF
jgi:high affinity Mn2+ porin